MKVFKNIFLPVWKLADDAGQDSGGDPKRTLKMILAIVGIVGASIVLFLMFRGGGTTGLNATVLAAFSGLGEVAAEETIKLLDGKGRIVVVANTENERTANPELQEEYKTFEKATKEKPDINVVATEYVETNPDSTSSIGLGGDVYLSMLEKHPDIDAIVSLVGPPVLDADQGKRLPSKFPKFIAVSLRGAPLKELLQAGIVQVAIIKRIEPAPSTTSRPSSPREAFDRLYQVITAENAAQLTE